MNWLCWHVGTVTDPKFRVIARQAHNQPGVVVAVWAYLLELAGGAKERGSIASYDADVAEEALGFSASEIEAIIAAMRAKGLIEGDIIAKWKDRQNMTNAERAREWREQRKAARAQTEQNDVREHTRAFANTTDIHTDKTDIHTDKTDIQTDKERDIDGESLTVSAPREKRASRLPEDWAPEPEPEIEADIAARELPRFADYWRAQPGAKGRKLDWQATWRNWCRKAREDRRHANPARANRFDASSAEAVRQRRAEIAKGLGLDLPGGGRTIDGGTGEDVA